MTRRGKTHAGRFIHARALLLCDAGADGPAWNVSDVAEALGVTRRSNELPRSKLRGIRPKRD